LFSHSSRAKAHVQPPLLWGFVMLGRACFLSTLAIMALPLAPAQTFADEPFRLFVCGIGTVEDNYLALDAIEHDDGTWSDLQFTIAEPGKPPLHLPPKPVPGVGNFFFANSTGPEGYLATVRFSVEGSQYLLRSLAIPAAGDNDLGGTAAALDITDADGTQRTIKCTEVYEFIGYMQQAMSCDLTNRYGAIACDYWNAPTRDPDDHLPAAYLEY
jgi:hypothetical protein